MSENSKIEWTDHTFNPWEGCQKVSPGCDHCYAETRNARFAGGTAINWGPGAPRRRTSPANWRKPPQWNKTHAEFFAAHGRRQRVFCASLADVFDNAVDEQWRADLFALIRATPNLDWLLLTKRIGKRARNARPSRMAQLSGSYRSDRLGRSVAERLARCDDRQSGRGRPATSRSCSMCLRASGSSRWSRCSVRSTSIASISSFRMPTGSTG
jgi:protein gp37